MVKSVFKVFFKVMLALGAIFVALAALKYFEEQRTDYIEIYNDDNLDGDYY